MASEVKLINFLCWITLIGLTLSAEIQPKLDILPMQSVQKKPVGKSLMLTCRPSVKDSNLITDLRWRDNSNNTIMPKAITEYKPLYDYQGRKLIQKIGANVQSMYTESLQGEQLALIIPSLTESMQGDYYCSAAYANSEMLETKVRIETYVAITWKNAPLNQNPILNSDYTIRCEVTANPSPTVDWLRKGDQIKSAGRYVIGIEGLLIKKVEEADDGIYTCRAAVIPTGELVERNIRVEVQIKPEITSLSSQYEAVEGQEFSVKCTGRGKPVPEFIWVNQDQKEVASADRFSVNPITGQMSISRVEEQDRGTYTCMARNSAGIAEQRTKLDIVVRPKVYEFTNITIPLNSEAAITCKATGRPAPEITFRRWGTKEEFRVGQQDEDDRIILEQNIDDERGESQGTLLISKTIRSDDGLYECVARNKGDAAFKVGHITVEYPPNFEHLKGLPPVFSWEERVANLSCFAMGIPNATVEWTWNERKISEMNDKFLQVVNDGIRSDLMVTPVNRRYYSAFKCTARNRLGTSEILMELREARIPGEVVQAKPSEVTATTVTFNIIAPATEIGLPIKAFSVQYKDERNIDWTTARNRTWTPDTPYVVEGLSPQTSYNFRFAARNDVGLGQFGAYVVQSTPPRSAPTPPKILNTFVEEEEGELPIVASTYADHFELIWNRPADNGEPIDFYNIRYCPGGKLAGSWNEIENLCKEHKYIQHSLTNFNMGDLNADTYYRIELSAHNSIGYSTPANLYVKTARGVDVIGVEKQSDTKSATIVLIAVAGILVLLIIVDFVCCLTVNVGILATCCRRTKRSPSDLDEEKLGSLYGWHLPYCSGSLIKERSPSPLPLPPPIVKLDPMTPADEDEKQPLNGNGINGAVKKNSTVDFDGRMAHSRSGDIIGKNSSV